jgi:hypothetical protein
MITGRHNESRKQNPTLLSKKEKQPTALSTAYRDAGEKFWLES